MTASNGGPTLALNGSDDLDDDAESIQRAPSTVSPSEPESILRALDYESEDYSLDPVSEGTVTP